MWPSEAPAFPGGWPNGQIVTARSAALHPPMDVETKLARLTADQLRKCALYIQAVATAAATTEERGALDLLATRFQSLALEKSGARPATA